MTICDFCKTNGVRYTTWADTDEHCHGENFELCGSCYDILSKKQRHYAYLAFKETVEEITGKEPRYKKKSWWNIFKR